MTVEWYFICLFLEKGAVFLLGVGAGVVCSKRRLYLCYDGKALEGFVLIKSFVILIHL